MHTVCAVPGGVTPHQLTFTIPEMLLDSPRLDHRIPDKLHVRMRLGIVGGGISGEAQQQQQRTTDELSIPALLENMPQQLSHMQIAKLLWLPNFCPLFILELRQFPDVAVQLHEVMSSLRSARNAEIVNDGPALLRLASATAKTASEASLRILPLSFCARSISYLNQRVPTRLWRNEQKERRLVHKQVAIKILWHMHACRPPPSFQARACVGPCSYVSRPSPHVAR